MAKFNIFCLLLTIHHLVKPNWHKKRKQMMATDSKSCPFCDFEYKSELEIKLHLVIHITEGLNHDIPKNAEAKVTEMTSVSDEELQPKNDQKTCHICNKVFVRAINLKKHLAKMHDIQPDSKDVLKVSEILDDKIEEIIDDGQIEEISCTNDRLNFPQELFSFEDFVKLTFRCENCDFSTNFEERMIHHYLAFHNESSLEATF